MTVREQSSHTDDVRARHAAEHPFDVATDTGSDKPKRNGLTWSGPVLAVAIAVAVLFIAVALM